MKYFIKSGTGTGPDKFRWVEDKLRELHPGVEVFGETFDMGQGYGICVKVGKYRNAWMLCQIETKGGTPYKVERECECGKHMITEEGIGAPYDNEYHELGDGDIKQLFEDVDKFVKEATP